MAFFKSANDVILSGKTTALPVTCPFDATVPLTETLFSEVEKLFAISLGLSFSISFSFSVSTT